MGHSTKFEDAIIRLNEAQARLMDAQITIMTQQAAMQTDSINISNVIGTIKVSMIIITPFIKKFVFCKHQAICWPWRIKILTSRGRKSIYGIQAINAKINLGCAISRNSILTSGGCGRSLGSPTLKGRRHKRIEVEADDHHEVTSENIVVYQPNQIKFPEKKSRSNQDCYRTEQRSYTNEVGSRTKYAVYRRSYHLCHYCRTLILFRSVFMNSSRSKRIWRNHRFCRNSRPVTKFLPMQTQNFRFLIQISKIIALPKTEE